jgi:hypothetical protein
MTVHWFVRLEGLDRPVLFDTQAEARSWADEQCPGGGYEFVEYDPEHDIGTFEDVEPPEVQMTADYIEERANEAAAAGTNEGEFMHTFSERVLVRTERREPTISGALDLLRASGRWPWS